MNSNTNTRRFARYFALPGHIWHHGVYHLTDLQPGYTR
ncbi:MAG: hypothetical protein QOF31_5655 [Mycobacterium sp.]|jgi:hypothetical protein|nr:hypothetical protein [Mycobacterium sp.]